MKDKNLKDKKNDSTNPKVGYILWGLFTALFFIAYGFELIQYGLFKIFALNNINTEFFYLWFSTNVTDVSYNIYIGFPLSFIPFILSIIVIEFSNFKLLTNKINPLAILVFQLTTLTYLLLKIIINAVVPLILIDYINDISVVLQYYQTSNSLKYLNVLFIVFVFIIYFNKLTIRLTKKVQDKDRSSNVKAKQ